MSNNNRFKNKNTVNNKFNETKLFLDKIGIKGLDFKITPSDKRFKDGGQYRFEVPGIQNEIAFEGLLSAMDDFDVIIHRVTQTKGIFLLTDDEISSMVHMAHDESIELFLSVGPRAPYDIGASVQTKEGSRIGYRLRGYENLVYAIEDVKRAINLGVRGILLYDEGLLWVLNKMRSQGHIPSNVKFKISAHSGHSNPASAKLLQELGVDSFNPVRDLPINMLSDIRNAIDISIDVHTENPKSSGGFIRHYEVPDIIRVSSPVYLKTGGSIAKHHGWDTTNKEAQNRVKQVYLVQSMIDRFYPDAIISKKGSK